MKLAFDNFRLIITLCLALMVQACLPEGMPKHLKPLSEETKKSLTQKGLKPGSAMLVRIFKKEAKLEAWLAKSDGTYKLFKTYEICNWSGKLGPKLKTGDKQAPEGFYVIAPSQMNPNSKYHLSFNLGYPNAYDKAYNRTGKHLMVHGGCSSAGCYAMTDQNVQEIYGLARDAFLNGQREFPVHAFPFRMTQANMILHEGHQWIKFWRNLKKGYDYFELNARPPVVALKGKRYVFYENVDQIPKAKRSRSRSRRLARNADPIIISGWQASSTAALDLGVRPKLSVSPKLKRPNPRDYRDRNNNNQNF